MQQTIYLDFLLTNVFKSLSYFVFKFTLNETKFSMALAWGTDNEGVS